MNHFESSRAGHDRRGVWGAFVLGIALGGLFDGILLHQVLQWHHLLSLVGDETLQDIRVQIFADGLFHVLMYIIGCVGLWLLWSGASSPARTRSSALVGMTLLGFGVWQIVDIVFFHWILRIHRIRVDVASPLPWDIGWMVVFGVPALALGCWLLVAARNRVPPVSPRGVSVALAAIMAGAAALSLAPPSGARTAIALFGDDVTPEQAFASIAASGAEIVWVHPSGLVSALNMTSDVSRAPLYRAGAVLVSGTIAPCAAWVKK